MDILPADSLNGERVAPGDIPEDAKVFRDWSTCACPEWPAELQAAAFYAQEALDGRDTSDKIEQFRTMYLYWFAMPERNKMEIICSYSAKYQPHPARLKIARREAREVMERAAATQRALSLLSPLS